MTDQNIRALADWGPKRILSDLANVVDDDGAAYFVKRYGVLLHEHTAGDLDFEEKREAVKAVLEAFVRHRGDPLYERAPLPKDQWIDLSEKEKRDVLIHANGVRLAWSAVTESEMQEVNAFLDRVFAARKVAAKLPALPSTLPDSLWGVLAQAFPSAIRADFSSGRFYPTPRTLMDRLAIELMERRKMLHRCENLECQKYMIKEFSRDRYCSRSCAESMRAKSQAEWQRAHKEEINKRRRKSSATNSLKGKKR